MIVIKLKIIVATYQVVASIGDVISVDFPETFTDFINGFSFMDLNLWNVVPLSCAVHISFIDKLLLVTLAPLAATSLLWVCFLLEYSYHRYHIQKNVNRRRGEKRNKFQELKEKYVNFLFYLSYLVLPGVTSTIFEIFICQDIDPNDEDKKDSDIYLVVDPTISCHSDYYYNGRLYAIFMILIYPIGIPSMYFYVLYKNRNEIQTRNEEDDPRTTLSPAASSIAFLYEAYEPKFWYWELIETTRRLTLTAVLSIVAQGTSEQAVFSVFMSILFVKLYAYFAPYIADSDDILAEVGQYQILFTFFGALIMQGSLVDPEYYGMVGGFLVCINIGVVIVPLYYAVEEYLTEKESIEQQNCEEEYKAKVSSHNPSEDPTNGENTVSNILLQSPLSDKSSSHAFETEVDSGDVELAIIQPRLSGNFHSNTTMNLDIDENPINSVILSGNETLEL